MKYTPLDREQLLADYEAYEALGAKIAGSSHDVPICTGSPPGGNGWRALKPR